MSTGSGDAGRGTYESSDARDLARSLQSALSDDYKVVRPADPDSAWAIVAADGYLILHDSTAALRSLGIFLDATLAHTALTTPVPGTFSVYISEMWPRAMLLRADLAAALNRTEEARLWYGRFVALWAGADPELQPIVARARSAYKQLGGS